jgi:hypothetical protein
MLEQGSLRIKVNMAYFLSTFSHCLSVTLDFSYLSEEQPGVFFDKAKHCDERLSGQKYMAANST